MTITMEQTRNFAAHLWARGRAPATINSMISAVNRFLKFPVHTSVNTARIYPTTTGAERRTGCPGVWVAFVKLTKFLFCQFDAHFLKIT